MSSGAFFYVTPDTRGREDRWGVYLDHLGVCGDIAGDNSYGATDGVPRAEAIEKLEEFLGDGRLAQRASRRAAVSVMTEKNDPLPFFSVDFDDRGQGDVQVYLYDDGVMNIAGVSGAGSQDHGVPRAEAIERLEAFLAEGAQALQDLREGRRPIE